MDVVESAGARLIVRPTHQPEIDGGCSMIDLFEDFLVVGTVFFGVAFYLFFLFRGELLGEERPTTAQKEKENQ
jgi:hypothetical protein